MLDPLCVARRLAGVVLVRLVHVSIALAVLYPGQHIAKQLGLATLELPTEFVQDRTLHSSEPDDREDRIHAGTERHRITEGEQRRRVDEDDVEPTLELIDYGKQPF